jgi:hypothetical protein
MRSSNAESLMTLRVYGRFTNRPYPAGTAEALRGLMTLTRRGQRWAAVAHPLAACYNPLNDDDEDNVGPCQLSESRRSLRGGS